MNSLKSFDIQLTDIWIECQKEMIEMRNKIVNLSDCLKTSELINRHLSKCNETLVAIVEKCKINDNDKEISVLIDSITSEEECIKEEVENLKTLKDKNIDFNEQKVLKLINDWKECKPKTKRTLTKAKGIHILPLNENQLKQKPTFDRIVSQRSGDYCEDNRKSKRERKVISYKALNEGFDCFVGEVEVKQEVDDIDVNAHQVLESNEKNHFIANDLDIDNKSETFESFPEEFANTETDSNYEEDFEDNEDIEDIDDSKRDRRGKKKKRLNQENSLKMSKTNILYKLSNNECVTEIDLKNKSIKKFYLKTVDSNGERIRIGFGCASNGCDFIADQRDQMLAHINRVHSTRKRLNCSLCDYSTRRKDYLDLHMANKHKQFKVVYYRCDEINCNFVAKNPNSLEQHKNSGKHLVHSANGKCITTKTLQNMIDSDETIEESDATNEWMRVYRLKPDDESTNCPIVGFGCKWPECEFLCAQKNRIIEHIGCEHLNDKPFLCDKCEYKTRNNRLLTWHKLQIHDINIAQVRIYQCEWEGCQYKNSQKWKLKIHENIHTGVRRFKCEWPGCGFAATDQSGLRHHTNMHNDVRPFVCNWPGCDHRFRRVHQMKAHQTRHGTDRPFSCDWPECDKKFRTNDGLRQHRVVHTGARKFACHWPACPKKFRDNAGLKTHLLIHLGEKPFACEYMDCTKRFRQKSQLDLHFRKKHSDKSIN